jgi:pyruvate/2-oxoglutarate dehydrogenase complex dihydrolipoamide dehydrogenase (E3) component
MDLQELPSHLIAIGGSYVGLEFGQMFRRLGSEVSVVEMFRYHLPTRRPGGLDRKASLRVEARR